MTGPPINLKERSLGITDWTFSHSGEGRLRNHPTRRLSSWHTVYRLAPPGGPGMFAQCCGEGRRNVAGGAKPKVRFLASS